MLDEYEYVISHDLEKWKRSLANTKRVGTIKIHNLYHEHDGYLFEDKGERSLPILKEELEHRPKDTYLLYQISHTLRVMRHYEEALPYFRSFYSGSKTLAKAAVGSLVRQ